MVIGICSLFLITMYSCDLTESIDDYEPLYSLESENSIIDEETSELAINGVYSIYRSNPIDITIINLLSPFANPPAYSLSNEEYVGWLNMNPIVSGQMSTDFYSSHYKAINNCNWIIEKVTGLSDNAFMTDNRKDEIVGEAKILRAMSHFYLLRLYGQFYDVDSKYGIDIRLTPVKNASAYARKTVLESYEAIIKDLDEAILLAPELRVNKAYVNKMFAKGLKAKVLLYKGDYSEAAKISKSIIDNTDNIFALESNFKDIFYPKGSTSIFNKPEVLFGFAGISGGQNSLYLNYIFGNYGINLNQTYMNEVGLSVNINGQSISYAGNRITDIFPSNMQGSYKIDKYDLYSTGSTETYSMWYQMRMSEVYLIHAEAEARSKNNVTSEALNALNAVRTRGGATSTGEDGFEVYPEDILLDQFLTAVRYEKLVELTFEAGENWFDLVRYDYIDGFENGFKISDLKVTATNSDKFILPIPLSSIEAGGGIVEQNPSY